MDFFLQGKKVLLTSTTPQHLAEYTHWRKWEGEFDILHEEESFASQQDRVRRINLLKNNTTDKSFYVSVLNTENELISLLEFYIFDSEVYSPNMVLKKMKNGLVLATEASELLIKHFFSYYLQIKTITFDLPDYRIESIKILESFGFKFITHYYKSLSNNSFQKMLIFRLEKQ